MCPPEQLLNIESTAIRLLVGREHSRHELQQKLLQRFPGTLEVVCRVLDDLQRRRLLSDERFVEQYVGSRTRKGYGPLRIRSELEERGIEQALIDSWLDPADADWAQQLREVARHKFGDCPADSQKEQARRARYLQYRGYPESLIRRYLWD